MSKKKTTLFLPTSYISKSDILSDLLNEEEGLDAKDGFKMDSPKKSPKPLPNSDSPEIQIKEPKFQDERKKPVIEKINLKEVL